MEEPGLSDAESVIEIGTSSGFSNLLRIRLAA